jgi:hypothetical protein
MSSSGGEGGIRTHGDRKATMLFESTPIVHSGTSPNQLTIINCKLSIVNFSFLTQLLKKLLQQVSCFLF